MKRSRFTQEQIIVVLKEHQAGATAADLCRKHGIRSCPRAWCRSGAPWRAGPPCQAATAGRLTVGLSLTEPMVSRVM